MFDNLEGQQIADYFNRAISAHKKANTTPDGKKEKDVDTRRSALYALTRFEGATYRWQAMDAAIKELPEGAITFDPKSGITASLDDIRNVLYRYIEIVEEMTGAPAIYNEIFTGNSAAWYVARELEKKGMKITARAITEHIRVNKDLRGRVSGSSMLFTREQLDEYVDNFHKLPKRGRPAVATAEDKS